MELFQKLLNTVNQKYKEADKHLGGWLPGGGTASPLTKAKQQGEQEMAERIRRKQNEYVGQPGRFAGQGQLMNALRATSQAGVNPVSVVTGDPKSIKTLAGYYQQSPSLMNEFDLNTNMFLRYLTGTGSTGLEIPEETGKQIYADIKEQEKKFNDPKFRASVINNPYNPGPIAKGLLRGETPVYYLGSSDSSIRAQQTLPQDIGKRWQIDKSLGSFWAEPGANQSYNITDRYNFMYAPRAKEGENVPLISTPRTGLAGFTAFLSPQQGLANVGRNIVKSGYGTPYTTNFQVLPGGKVIVR